MTAKTEKKPNNQMAAFRKAARELGANASDERFKDVLRTIGKAKPSPMRDGDKDRARRKDGD
jgi:hypothetical protein